jgi:hypothetical protein
MRREDEMRSGAKMNHGGGVYTTTFPTELPTEHRIIFFWAVALHSFGNFCWYLNEVRTKNFKNLSRFFDIRRQIHR